MKIYGCLAGARTVGRFTNFHRTLTSFMAHLMHHPGCPVCNAADITVVFPVKDYTVSGEIFTVVECNACSLRFTRDIPGPDVIGVYYKSENYISHTNTSAGFINRLYQAVRKRTLRQKRKLIQKITGLKRGTLLDVGSGTGAFAHTMKTAGWEVTGLEPDMDARAVAKQLYGMELDDSSQLFRLQAASMDVITLWHVLEHVHDLHGYVAQLKSLLKPHGKLLVAVPNYASKDAEIYKEYWAAYDVPRHLYHFSPRAMGILMEKHGLQVLQHRPMWYDSFYVSMLSSKYKNGKTNLMAAFFNGVRSNLKAMGDVRRCSSVIYVASPNPSKGGALVSERSNSD